MRLTVWKNGAVQRFLAAKTGYILDKGDTSVIRWSGLGIIKYAASRKDSLFVGGFADESKKEIILRSCDAPLAAVSWVKLF